MSLSVLQYLKDLINVGVVAGIILEVLVQQPVARTDHQRGAQLERPPPGVSLPVSFQRRSGAGDQLGGLDQRAHAHLPGAGDLGGGAVFVEEHLKGNRLVFDESLGVPLAAGSYRSDVGTRIEDFLISVADLTGPFTAGQSAEMAKEEDDPHLLGPSVAEPVLRLEGVDEDLIGQRFDVERHGTSLAGYPPCLFPRHVLG